LKGTLIPFPGSELMVSVPSRTAIKS